METLQCKNLSFAYPTDENRGANFALCDINFTLCGGNIMLICGNSGSGKSTLLRLLKPSLAPFGRLCGEISVDGKALFRLDERYDAAQIGYVGQDPEGAPVTENVLSELCFLPENLGMSPDEIRRRVAEISAFFGLEPLLSRKISELSGGQKQLVNLAAVMSADPSLLLLDEPTAQLDPLAAAQFHDAVMRAHDELGTTVVICEHNTELFFADCTSILFLENGRQRFVLPPDEAAARLDGTDFLAGFPCAVRLWRALKTKKPLRKTSEAVAFVRANFKADTAPPDEADEVSRGKAAICAENISFRYDRYGADVVDRLNFTAFYGEVTAICGANGTGKSTLLKLLAGAFPAQEGKITVAGKKIGSYKHGALYKGTLSMLSQNPSDIMIEQTVADELSRSSDGEKYAHEKVSAVLDELGFDRKLLGAHPFDLSGGELQRAAIAKLLLTDCKILLLDEPSKGLDVSSKKRLSRLFRRLAESGKAVIFVTHDLDFAAETADRAALVFGGKIAANQPAEKFFSQNTLYTTAAARISRNVFRGAVTSQKLIEACKNARKGAENEVI